MDNPVESPASISPSAVEGRKKQRKLFSVLVGSIVVLLLMFMIQWASQNSHDHTIASVPSTAPVYDVSRQVDDKSYWMYKSEQALKEQAKTQETLQKKMDVLETKLLEPTKAASLDQVAEQASLLGSLQKRVEQLELGKEKIEGAATESHTFPDQQWLSSDRQPLASQSADRQNVVELGANNPHSHLSPHLKPPLPHPPIFSEKLILTPKPDALNSKIPHIDHYIPVGSFARAVLLNGVDVSVGVSAQQNPQPLLLRLIDKGNLPNGAVGDMKDCRMIGAAHGDYSSERALVRIEKLSCVQKDNSVIETDVGGFVVGTDGKAGLRGPMITRDGELLTQGFISGLFSGLGKAVSSASGTASVTPFGAVNTIQGKDILKKAGGEGTGNAFEILSRYAIKRLEQLQPVIQISANREVDIVFHTGSQFGEKRARVQQKRTSEPTGDVKIEDFFGKQSE